MWKCALFWPSFFFVYPLCGWECLPDIHFKLVRSICCSLSLFIVTALQCTQLDKWSDDWKFSSKHVDTKLKSFSQATENYFGKFNSTENERKNEEEKKPMQLWLEREGSHWLPVTWYTAYHWQQQTIVHCLKPERCLSFGRFLFLLSVCLRKAFKGFLCGFAPLTFSVRHSFII